MIGILLQPDDTSVITKNNGSSDTLFALWFPIEKFSFTYRNSIEPVSEKAEHGHGMFSHPPFARWPGGEVDKINIKTKLAAGGPDGATPSEPTMATSSGLVTFLKLLYSYLIPQSAVRVEGITPIPARARLTVCGAHTANQMNIPQVDVSTINAGLPLASGRPSWFSIPGYVTELTSEFGPPWDYVTGEPMVADISLTFTYSPSSLPQTAPTMTAEDAINVFLPLDTWSFVMK